MGRSILDHLVSLPTNEQPESVTLVSRTPISDVDREVFAKLQIKNVLADLTQPWTLDHSITHIIQLAADGSSNAYGRQAAIDFVQISRQLIAWCELLESKPVVFHASSGACFGYFPLITANQDPKEWMKSEFVEGRLRAERLLQDSDELGTIDLRIARLYSFIGRHLRGKAHYAVPSFVSMAKSSRLIRLSGNPLTTRSFLSAQEMALWVVRAVSLETKPTMVTIGSSVPVTMIELAEFVADHFSADVHVENRNAVGDTYVADNSLTKKTLGVNENTHWQQSLLEFIQESPSNDLER